MTGLLAVPALATAPEGLGTAALVAVRVLVAGGVIVIVPVGLRLVGGAPGWLVRWWPLPGAAGAASMWAPRGALAVATAAVYAAAAWLLALCAARRACRWWGAWRRPGSGSGPLAVEIAAVTALCGPAVAATALVAERGGWRLFGFDLDVLTLTVPHLHYAGFVAALVAGLVARQCAGGAAAALAACAVPAGTVLVLLGYFVDDVLELAGAVVLTAGMWLVGWLTVSRVRPRVAGLARAALAASSLVLVATMLLALWWALGEVTGWAHPTLGWMVATHGVTNALGFAGCAVLAWRTIAKEPL